MNTATNLGGMLFRYCMQWMSWLYLFYRYFYTFHFIPNQLSRASVDAE